VTSTERTCKGATDDKGNALPQLFSVWYYSDQNTNMDHQ